MSKIAYPADQNQFQRLASCKGKEDPILIDHRYRIYEIALLTAANVKYGGPDQQRIFVI